MNRFLIVFLFYCFFPFHVFGAFEGDSLEGKIHEIVQKYHKNYFFHGNVIVKRGDRIIYQNSFGLANESFEVPNTMRSRFMIASVSKQFTAALVMILAQEGLIDIHRPYSYYVPIPKEHMDPKNWERWNKITTYELLTHTAGLYGDVLVTDIYNPGLYESSIAIILDEQLKNYDIFPLSEDKPGYSNFGYMLLAYLAETVSNKGYGVLVKDKIFKPLGMKSSGEYHRMKTTPFMTEGYFYLAGGELNRRCCHDSTSFKGSHSLYSDAEDLIIWLDNLNSENPKVLTRESIELMTKVHVRSEQMTYGFGFHVDKFNGAKRYWHDGFEYGYLSLVSLTPEKDLKIVVLGNRHQMNSIVYNSPYTKSMNDEISQLF